jgi:transposase
MQKSQETLQNKDTTIDSVLYIAFELSDKNWKLASSDGNKRRYCTITARDLSGLQNELKRARWHFRTGAFSKIVTCYEAGRDGFWLHRYLQSCGIENLVVDSASIEVDRRKRRAKTDRIDAGKLLRMLIRYCGGEKGLWRVVRVPSLADEDARQLTRELDCLKKERTRHCARIRGLLIQQGLKIGSLRKTKFRVQFDRLRLWDGQQLPPGLRTRVLREYDRLRLVEEQIDALEDEKAQMLKNADTPSVRKIARLQMLYGIGTVSSWTCVHEFFGWREFKNRREVAALAGLTPTPYDSGADIREQGISKAGNRRIRTLSIEMAWAWLRFQPNSKLTLWYNRRFASGGKRMRKIGIVAVARRLLIDIWRYLDKGIVPEGARLRPMTS